MTDRPADWRARAAAAVAAAGIAAAAWSAAVWLTGGFVIAGVTSKAPSRSLFAAIVLLALAFLLDRRASAGMVRAIAGRGASFPPRVAAAAAIALLLVAVAWNSDVAGGSDSSCYVLQADALRHGELALREPLAHEIPIARPDAFFAPTGFLASPVERGAAVPICGPGLALAMTAASFAGARALWLVVPLCAALLVWSTFVLGRLIGGDLCGAASAVLVACSPIVIYQSVQPMSDVPAAALFVAALAAVGRRDRRGAIAGGLIASAAVLVRPNLALPLPFLGLFLLTSRAPLRARLRQLAAFGIAALPFIVTLAWLNTRRYGSPLVSGYGDTGVLFAFAHVLPNAGRYSRWLLSSETPFLALAIATPWLAWKRRGESGSEVAMLGFVCALLVMGTYFAYTVFDDWWYVRFLLPAIPLLLILSMAVVLRLASARSRARTVLGVIACATVTVALLTTARERRVLDLKALESRFLVTGGYAARALPPNAIVLAVQQSGSVRYHGGRLTAMWDQLQPDELDGAIAWLESHGRPVYVALEDSEEPKFRARFSSQQLGALDWPPVAEVHAATRVRIYRAGDRIRFRQGAVIDTEHVR